MPDSRLFSQLKLKSITFRNRIILSPMCQYKAHNGFITDWHKQHYSRFAFSGLGGAFLEATAISKDGRITHGCLGIWHDQHIDGLRKIASIFKEHNCVSGIQLAHSGRKGSCLRPWDGAISITDDTGNERSWATFAPSPIPTSEGWQTPKELKKSDIERIKLEFYNATRRANEAGFLMLEIHGAHGYLLHSFVSPISNKRTDRYGGNLSSRLAFPLEIAKIVRSAWPEDKPLFYRISSSDNMEGGLTIEDNIILSKSLKSLGIDVIDCSSGGIKKSPTLSETRLIPGYQVPYSQKIKNEAKIQTMAVGAIIGATQAESIVKNKRADLVALGRELLADTQWTYKAAQTLIPERAKEFIPPSYSFYLTRRDKFLDRSADPL